MILLNNSAKIFLKNKFIFNEKLIIMWNKVINFSNNKKKTIMVQK